MYGFFRVVAFLLAIGLLAAVGIGLYNAGVSAGIGTEVGVPPYVGQPWGWGWVGGIFGFVIGLFFLLLFFGLIFGLFRAAFGWGHHGGGHHGWDHARYGSRTGEDGSGRRRSRHDYFEEWHRELHAEGAGAADSADAPARSDTPTTKQA